MNLRKIFISAVLAVYMLASLASQALADTYTLTLKDAIELALKNSPDIKKAEANLEYADITALNAKLDYESAYTKWAGSYFKASAFEADSKAKRKAKEAAEDNLDYAKTTLDNTRETIKYDVESQYLKILNMEDQLRNMENTLQVKQNQVKIEKIKRDLGLSSNLQVDQAQEKAEATANQLQGLKDSLSSMYWNLSRTIGKEPQVKLVLLPVTFQPVKYEDRQTGLNSAVQISLALEQYNRDIENKKEELDELNENSSEKAQKLEVEIKQKMLSINDATYSIEIGTKQAFEKMELAKKKIIETQNAYLNMKTNYSYLEKQYDLGLIPKLSLDEAKLGLDQAHASYVKATYDYYLATREVTLAQKAIFISVR